ncbi:MAG: SDR family oxidoreductase [Smithella sp.]|nr:SDR family oxidoreductase [Smithella sp.]
MTQNKECVGVIGATSIIGKYLLPLLLDNGYDVVAFSRYKKKLQKSDHHALTWALLPAPDSGRRSDHKARSIRYWISLAPITALPNYYSLLLDHDTRHIVALSSTSRFTKLDSSDLTEKALAFSLAEKEKHLTAWSGTHKLSFTILRPTMVYDWGHDKNITVLAAFIKRFSFFCLFGEAQGLRQPVHARDVASACASAISSAGAVNRSYNLSGAERLTYREMVSRIFSALGKKPRFVKCPLWLFSLAVFVLRVFPRYRQWSAAMAQRMNKDMVFDHSEACNDLGFMPRPFDLHANDSGNKNRENR